MLISPRTLLLIVTVGTGCSGHPMRADGPPPLARSGALVATIAPPAAERRSHPVTHHGITLNDPYHWLRDPAYPDVSAPDVLAYLEAENDYFDHVMKPHEAATEAIFEELKSRLELDEEAVPWRDGDYVYRWRFAPDSEYRIWTRTPAAGGAEQVIMDEPAQAAGREYFRLGTLTVSEDGRYLAWSADYSGAERYTLQVTDLVTGESVGTPIVETDGSAAWSTDGETLLYVRLEPGRWRPYQVWAHRRGSDPADDRLLFEETGDFFLELGQTQSRRFLVFSAGDHVTSEIHVVPADDPYAAPMLVAVREPGVEYDLEHARGRFFIRINDTHKNFRLVTAPEETPQRAHWQEAIAGSDKHYLRGLTAFRDFMVIEERIDGLDQIRIRDYDGDEHYVSFPEASYTAGLGNNPEFDVDFIRIDYESMVTPDTVFDYPLETRELVTRKVQTIPSGYDAGDYETLRLMAPARDGVEIPLSVVYRKGYRRDNEQPLHVYGYGAYGIASTPWFSSSRVSLLDRGFAYAVAHVRGGDELGYRWYEDGKLQRRANTFNDFIDATRYLIRQGFGAEGRVSASGGSAGGELMGAVVNQQPGLWGAIVAHVPFVDVLNTMLDASLPLPPLEWPEWGDPVSSRADFELIRSYSPYDQVRETEYPPMFITAGINDPRVVYWEPAKWTARLRRKKTDSNVLLLKTNMGAGHGGKSGRFAALYEVAEEYAFLLLVMRPETLSTAAGAVDRDAR
jgi:oligopeptidase B